MSLFPRLFNYFAITLAILTQLPTLSAATYTVGEGAPTDEIVFLFQTAWSRNGFSAQAAVPLSSVKTLQIGATVGLYQEFSPSVPIPGSTAPAVTLALVMPNQNAPASNTAVLQVTAGVYAYYTTLGLATVGFPTTDTQNCPSVGPSSCTYQIFTNDYALFAYSSPLPNGQTCESGADTNCVYIKDPEYTKWQSLGGISSSVGIPISVTSNITASTGTTSTQQLFTGGAFYGLTSGSYSGNYSAVVGSIYTTYVANLGPSGALGLPLSNQVTLPGGTFQQTFEGGTIQYTTGSTPVVLLPVSAVRIVGPENFTTAIQLNLNGSAQINALVFGPNGTALTGRTVAWSVTNPNVVSLAANGAMATITGIGGGNASITATVNGVASPALPVTVIAPCCQVGDGAPAAVQQAFLDALSRNQLKVTTPLPTGAQRVGNGYVQTMTPVGSTQPILVAEADSSSLAYVVSGPILVAYQNSGGPSGPAGYPTSDVTAGGRQSFANASIAGNPAFMVQGQILTKWSALSYETGAAGVPTGAATAFTTAIGETGIQQPFQGGTIFGITSGPYHGQTYLVSGLILARYTALGGPAGAYGAPLSDETVSGTLHRQNFENGYITYTPGDTVAVDYPNPRIPAISAFPASAIPGSRLVLSVSGFSNGDTVTVSVTNQPDFTVTLPAGAFSWNYVVPPASSVGTVKLQAVDAAGNIATGSFSIQSTASLGAKLSIVQGNAQSGGVGSLLPLPLQVSVLDSSGNPLPNITVTFIASPGATISTTSAQTDSSGLASTMLRLQASTGIAEVTAQALGQSVTFGAQSVSRAPLSVPAMTATSTALLGAGPATIAQKGTLLTAAAMILGFYQNAGQISSPNGAATPVTLNKYLNNCGSGCDGYVTNPDTGEQVVNLWRLTGFSGGLTDMSIEKTDIPSIQALVAGGSPVLLELALTANGVATGGTSVVVTGVANDGSLVIADPNPVLARTSMNDYLYGFQINGVAWNGTIVSAARILVQRPLPSSFIVAAVSQPTAGGGVSIDVEAPQGGCPVLQIPDAAAIGSTAAVTPRSSGFAYCSGAYPAYQASLTAPAAYRAFVEGDGLLKDLSASSPAAYALTFTTAGALTVAPQVASFTANGVLNAATFVSGLAPGGLFSIFGSGLFGPSADTTVTFGTEAAPLILKSPFQLNGQVPGDLAPGSYPVTIQSAWGSATQPVFVSQTAPGIFVENVEAGNRTVGAVINQDGTLNDLGTPAHRGDVLTVYCTNLGAVQSQGNLNVTVSPVSALLNSVELPVQYSGLTPGFIGLYQVNVPVPGGTTPGTSLPLVIQAGGIPSNTVNVAIQ